MEEELYAVEHQHRSFKLTHPGMATSTTFIVALVVLLLGGVIGYILGQNFGPNIKFTDLGLTGKKTATATATPAATTLDQKFTHATYAISFSYPSTWAAVEGAKPSDSKDQLLALLQTADFSGESTSVSGTQLEVLALPKKQTKDTALTAPVVAAIYESVKSGSETTVGTATVKVWEYQEPLQNGNKVLGFAKIFVSADESYALNFVGKDANDLQLFDNVVASMNFTKESAGSSSSGSTKKKATPTPLPTNATFFER